MDNLPCLSVALRHYEITNELVLRCKETLSLRAEDGVSAACLVDEFLRAGNRYYNHDTCGKTYLIAMRESRDSFMSHDTNYTHSSAQPTPKAHVVRYGLVPATRGEDPAGCARGSKPLSWGLTALSILNSS